MLPSVLAEATRQSTAAAFRAIVVRSARVTAMSEAVSTGLLDRAIRRITTVWRDMAATVGGEADETLEAQMRACLAGRGGEVSARNRAAKLAETYLAPDEAGRKAFLRTLANFDSDPDAVTDAFNKVQAAEERPNGPAPRRHCARRWNRRGCAC